MNIEEKDIITLDGDKDYSVFKIIDLESKKIFFLADMSDLSIIKFMYLKNNNKLVEIIDKDLILKLKEIASDDNETIKSNIDETISIISDLLGEEY